MFLLLSIKGILSHNFLSRLILGEGDKLENVLLNHAGARASSHRYCITWTISMACLTCLTQSASLPVILAHILTETLFVRTLHAYAHTCKPTYRHQDKQKQTHTCTHTHILHITSRLHKGKMESKPMQLLFSSSTFPSSSSTFFPTTYYFSLSPSFSFCLFISLSSQWCSLLNLG